MKKKYVLITLVALVVFLFGYHFYAAHQAEVQLDEAIQKEAQKAGHAVSVQYSAIDVSPFGGDIDFRDVTAIQDSAIERASDIHIDLSYLDFLALYLGGTNFALKHLSEAQVLLRNPSFVNRSSLREIKLDTLRLTYRGNAWDAIRNVITNAPLQNKHQFVINGVALSYSQPGSTIGSFRADSMNYQHNANASDASLIDGPSTLEIHPLTWTPPEAFQLKYAFFIRGFGFKPDSVPISRASFALETNQHPSRIRLNRGTIRTNLFNVEMDGSVSPAKSLSMSRIDSFRIRLLDLSQSFENVLDNAHTMFHIQLPREGNTITFRLEGTVADPIILKK